MALTENQLIELALCGSKDFSKEIRKYFSEMSRERPLTEQEQKLYETTHRIHAITNDALVLLNRK